MMTTATTKFGFNKIEFCEIENKNMFLVFLLFKHSKIQSLSIFVLSYGVLKNH